MSVHLVEQWIKARTQPVRAAKTRQ